MKHLIAMTDGLANDLEAAGLMKEASELDMVSNLMEKLADDRESQNLAMKAGVPAKVWGDMIVPERLALGKWIGEKSTLHSDTGKNFDVLHSVLNPEVAARAEIQYEHAKDTRKDLLPGIENVRKWALEDLDYVKKGLKLIPELVKYVTKANEDALVKLMGNKKFVDEAVASLGKGGK